MFTIFSRIIHYGLQNFRRSGLPSATTVAITSLAPLVSLGLILFNVVTGWAIASIQNKIDITAYFKVDTQEIDILQVKSDIMQQLPQIKSVAYVSRDQALENFNAKHADNSVFTKALSEVGDNPFLPSLNITTNSSDASQYEKIANILNQDTYNAIIEKVDFSEKKDIIEKVFAITSSINRFGLGLAAVLMLIVILVVFNTMKLIIQASKEEIATMRIVGASSWFIRLPFIIEGGMFGFISFIFCLVVTIIAVYFLSPIMAVMTPGFSLMGYFIDQFLVIMVMQLGAGVTLGALSSFIVVRKYLKV